jgi:hypothetical protein
MMVYHDNSMSPEQAALARVDLIRKATIWFTVSDKLRVKHLLGMCEKEYSSAAVFRKLFDNVAPAGGVRAVATVGASSEGGSSEIC